eukprot:6732877-Prymnesium_polylepis.1
MGARVTLSDSSSLSGEEGLFDTIRRNMAANRALIDAAHGAVDCIELQWCVLCAPRSSGSYRLLL